MDSTKPFLLSKDRQESVIRENKFNQFHNDKPTASFAVNNGIKISNVAKNLFLKGGGIANYSKERLQIDMELADIRQELATMALTPNGFDSPVTGEEQINVDIVDNGMSIDIRVEVFESET